jgi:hypothetical protein
VIASERKGVTKYYARTSIAVKVQNDRRVIAAERRGYPPAVDLLAVNVKIDVAVTAERNALLQESGASAVLVSGRRDQLDFGPFRILIT